MNREGGKMRSKKTEFFLLRVFAPSLFPFWIFSNGHFPASSRSKKPVVLWYKNGCGDDGVETKDDDEETDAWRPGRG